MFVNDPYYDAPKNSAEFFGSAMGPAETVFHEQRQGVLVEPAWTSDLVAKMEEVEASDYAVAAGKYAINFGTHKFTIPSELVKVEVDGSMLSNNESLERNPNDIRNYVGGDHLKYINNLTDDSEYESTPTDVSLSEADNTVIQLDDYRRRVAEQFPQPGSLAA